MTRKSLAIFFGLLLIAGLLVLWRTSTPGPSAPAPGDVKPGWSASIAGALADATRRDPRLIVVTRAGWSGYEKSIFEHPAIAPLIEPLGRAQVDFTADTARLSAWGVEGAPALVLVTADGRLITRLVGPRDMSVVKKAIERSSEFPLAREDLARREDTPAVIRAAEVAIELGEFETATVMTRGFLEADRSAPETARGRYLHLYALAEDGKMPVAARMAADYLKDFPEGEDRSAVLWILAVIDLQANRDRAALERIEAIRTTDSGSVYARQAIIAYSMEYLARAKQKLADADRYLTQCIEAGSPWRDDLILARSYLRFARPESAMAAIEDLKQVARGANALLADEAQERLVGFAAQADPSLQSQIILFFQDLVRRPAESGSGRLRLARLYLANENLQRAREEARTIVAGGGEQADDALLLLGVIALEVERDPAAAVPIFTDLIAKFPSRETLWPAKYGLARAYFFSGEIKQAEPALEELLGYLAGRRYLPEPFLMILARPMPPAMIRDQLKEYAEKVKALLAEEQGEAAFKKLMSGVINASRGETEPAFVAFQSLVSEHPASSVADDALFEEARLHLRDGRIDEARVALTRITTSYKGSDQFAQASEFLEAMKDIRRR
jgi:tetratricopeptide (TPR) repeat protein